MYAHLRLNLESMTITIYHNNACSNSRGALALIREAGVEPVVIDYLKEPPTRARLAELIAQAGLTVRGAMRDKGDLYAELGLADPALSDDALLDAMVAHPALINRPFVVTEKGVRLCRPPALVDEIL
ncbi:arsenate reductase [Pseudoduganella plicata]|uniref:Arsenate reductase n=2 Tax=Pseudoduganella plicata TaxID=321984 RepID=A0AA87Y5N8_9BURK|nr:arsenate reductase [Pseudoduganella plicata]